MKSVSAGCREGKRRVATGPRRCYIRCVLHSLSRTGSIRISFLPHARESTIRAGQTALEAAHEAGTGLVAPCEGAGHCGKCVVRFLIHAPELSPWDVLHLEADAIEEGYRLACTARPAVDCIISVPKQPPTIVIDDHPYPYRLSPPAQTAQITASDANAAEELRSVLPVVALRETPRGLTLRSTGRELRAVDLGWDRADHLGVAVSVHTDLVEGTLHDLRDGRQLANATAKLIGDTRSHGLNAATITSAVRRLVRALCDDARVSPSGVADIIVLGLPPGAADTDERLRTAGMGTSPPIDMAAAAAIACAPASEAPVLLLGVEPYPWALCSEGGSARLAIAPDARPQHGIFRAAAQPVAHDAGPQRMDQTSAPMSAKRTAPDLGTAVDLVVDLRRAGLLDRRGTLAPSLDGSEAQRAAGSDEDAIGVDGFRFPLHREHLRQEHVRGVQRLRATLRTLRDSVLDGMGVHHAELQKVALTDSEAASLGYPSLAALDILAEVPAPLVHGFPNAAHVGTRLALLSTSAAASIAALARRTDLLTLSTGTPAWAEGLYLDLTGDGRALDGPMQPLLDFPSPRRSTADRPPAVR